MSPIQYGVALLAAATLACVVLGPASARTRTTSKYGGTLVVGIAADPDTLDPTVQRVLQSLEVLTSICQSLYTIVPNHGSFQRYPQLAASQPVLSQDKLSLTVQLRQGIQFNDGTPFNADAVVTTVERNQTNPRSVLKNPHLDSVTATGPYTVVFHLNQRDSSYLANPMVMSPTQLNKLGDSFGTSPVCVGPFMFDHRVVGDHITVIKSPYYYDKQHVYLDKIVYKPIDAQAAAAALQAGDVQALDRVATTDVPTLQQNPSLRIIRAIGAGWDGIWINLGNKNGVGNLPYAANVGTPLSSSPMLRQAFEDAIDRNTLAKVVYGGLQPPSCTPIPQALSAWFDANITCSPYDPKQARKLVAKSGFSNPTVHLMVRPGNDMLRLAQFIQAQEVAVGINVVIDTFDATTATARATSGNFDVYILSGCCSGSGDPNAILSSRFRTSGTTNVAGYSNPRLDLILDNGVKATSIKVRKKLYDVAQEIIAVDRPIIVFAAPVRFAASSANVVGLKLNPAGLTLDVANAQYK